MAKNIKDSYKFVTNNNDETQCIGLTHDAGRFQGVIYKYGKVSVPDPEEMKTKSDLPLSFHYDIVDNNSLPKEFFNEDFNYDLCKRRIERCSREKHQKFSWKAPYFLHN